MISHMRIYPLTNWVCVAILVVLGIACQPHAFGKSPVKRCAIYRDPASGPISFAARDIRDEMKACGYSVVLKPPGKLADADDPVRIVLTARSATAAPNGSIH